MLFSSEQLRKIEEVISVNGEILVQVDYPHSGGDGRTLYLLKSFDQFSDLVSRQYWPEIEIIVFCEKQFPLRGKPTEELLEEAIKLIPDGERFSMVDLEDLYPAALDHVGHGSSHVELRSEFLEINGFDYVGIGVDQQELAYEGFYTNTDKTISVHYYRQDWTENYVHPNRFNCVGESPLEMALWEGPDAVEKLISNGADVNAKGLSGETALHYALRHAWSIPFEIIQKLLSSGADANAKNDYGRTPFFYVSRRHDLQRFIELLMSYGADINAVDNGGGTVLDFDTCGQNQTAEKILRSYGAKTKNELMT